MMAHTPTALFLLDKNPAEILPPFLKELPNLQDTGMASSPFGHLSHICPCWVFKNSGKGVFLGTSIHSPSVKAGEEEEEGWSVH